MHRAFIEAPGSAAGVTAHTLSPGQREADTGQESQWAKWSDSFKDSAAAKSYESYTHMPYIHTQKPLLLFS